MDDNDITLNLPLSEQFICVICMRMPLTHDGLDKCGEKAHSPDDVVAERRKQCNQNKPENLPNDILYRISRVDRCRSINY